MTERYKLLERLSLPVEGVVWEETKKYIDKDKNGKLSFLLVGDPKFILARIISSYLRAIF